MSGTPTGARPRTTMESLGGPWATNFQTWLVLLIPAVVVSGYQDSALHFPSAFVAAIAAVTECAAAALPFMVVSVLRRRTRIIPLAICIPFWASVGVIHGLAGGFLVVQFAGADPNYLGRVIFWAVSCLIWLPLTTYAVAQFTDRRRLLATLAYVVRAEDVNRTESSRELGKLHSLIVASVRENVRPVVVDIARSLEAIGPALDADQLSALGDQLSGVSEETSRIIATTSPVLSGAAELVREPLPPLTAALDFEQDRPARAALLTAVALLPIVPLSFGYASLNTAGVATSLIVLLVGVVVMGVGMATPRLSMHRGRNARLTAALAIYGVAALATSVAAYFGPWQPHNQQNEVLALLLIAAEPFAAVAISAAVGLGNANLELVHQTDTAIYRAAQLDASIAIQQDEIREQLAAVTHGPLRGRLAACAMALNFHAAEVASATPERTRLITDSVREHLADALRELDALR